MGRFIIFGYFILLSIVALGAVILFRSGEMASVLSIVDRQQSGRLIYGGLAHPLGQVKLESLKKRQAQVVVMGTSRSLHVRESVFNRDFYNLGGLSNGPYKALSLWRRHLSLNPPELIILFADWWGYGESARTASKVRPISPIHFDGERAVQRPDTLLWKLLADGLLPLADIPKLVFGGVSNTIGLNARRTGQGFRPDGSFCLGEKILEHDWISVFRTKGFLRKASHFLEDQSISASAMHAISVFVDEVLAAGTELMIIAPPIAPLANRLLQDDPRYMWITKWRESMKRRFPSVFYDGHDAAAHGAGNAEFFDEIHPGEVAMARLLLSAVEANPKLEKHIIRDAIKATIDAGSGKIASPAFHPGTCTGK